MASRGLAAWAVLALLSSSALASLPLASPRDEIRAHVSGDFDALIRKWSVAPARSRTLAELKKISLDPLATERSRYIALMGAASLAKLEGRPEAIRPVLQRLKKDPSWVMRSASLEASAQALGAAGADALAVELLQDPALVVRSRAVDLISSPASAPALARAALDPRNHPGGRALWVPQKAIRALVRLDARQEIQMLARVLGQKNDPSLRRELAQASLTASGAPGTSKSLR